MIREKAPPLGAMPRNIWIAHRFWDLANACNRYMAADKPIPAEWVHEMREHFHMATKHIQPDEDVIKWKKWLWPREAT